MEELPNEIRNDALKVLLQSTRGLASCDLSISEMTRKTIRKISSLSWVQKNQLVETISGIVHYDGKRMPESALRDWVTLRDDLIGSTFSDLLKRYVQLDMLEDHFHNSEKYDETWIESKVHELAERVVENPNLLNPEYSWLTTEEAKRGHQFGYALGLLDESFAFLDNLIEHQIKAGSNGSLNFLGGYFRALFEKNSERWEGKLDTLSEINSFKKNIPELTWRSGMTDRAAERILSMLQKADIELDSLGIFKFGGALRKMSEVAFTNWASFILAEPSGKGAPMLLNFVHSYYVFETNKPLRKDIALNVLVHQGLWDESKMSVHDTMKDFYWKEVALKLISVFPETNEVIAKHILSSLGTKKSMFHGFPTEAASEVLLEIAKNNPKGVWQELISFLNPSKGEQAFYIMQWLRGGIGFEMTAGALSIFNIEDSWKWADEKPEERARFLARCVSPVLFHSSDKTCLARELLARYGNREDVRGSLSGNYFTEGWTGPASLHFIGKKNALLEFKKEEKNENVIKWIDENLEILEERIDNSKMTEEKEFG